jgi:hypothetical protein
MAALIGALAPAANAAAGPLPDGAAPYGLIAFNANGVPGTSVAARSSAYRRLYDAGVRAIRLDIPWTEVQPVGGHGRFDFSGLDPEISAIRAAGMKIIGILDYGNPDYSQLGRLAAMSPLAGGLPPFAVGSAQYFPPDNPADFARYAAASVTHYRGDAVAWEVWNEENEGWRFWPPHEDAAAYARLLCATYPAVKSADPGSPVLFGGVFFPAVAGLPGTSGPDFVAQAYAADPNVGRCFDALAYHPYAYPFTAPELDLPVRGSVIGAADAMRSVLRAHGDRSKPLWITEVGWPTHDRTYGVPELKQAQYVARMEAVTASQGVPALTWYTYGDSPDPTGGANQEAWFGFFRSDGTRKPAYGALATFTSVFDGARFAADLSRKLSLPAGNLLTGGRGFALRFTRPGADVTALWLANESVAEGQGSLPPGGTLPPASLTVELPVVSSTVTVTDFLGSARQLTASAGRVRLRIGPGPIYVTDRLPAARRRRACWLTRQTGAFTRCLRA